MTRVLLDETIETDYGQFDLGWGDGFEGFAGDFDEVFAGQVNGLAGAAHPGGLYLNLARRSGGSPVRIELMDLEPADDEQFEDVVEVSILVGAGAKPGWMTWAGEDGGPLELPPGSYRVRVNARGRDAGADDEFAEEAVDFYLIQLWPAESRPDEIARTTSANAAYWHREVGNRR